MAEERFERTQDGRARLRMRRRLEWIDTDGAERWHYTTFFRYAEAAEAELHRALQISERTFGSTPRVHVEADFLAPLYFDDLVDVTITVGRLGRTSVSYDVELARDGQAVARGRLVSPLTDGHHGGTVPWPDDLARALVAPAS